MRIGIFGGSFDPPHLGHLLAAVDATESLSLDRLFWVPAARQPFKVDPSALPSSSADQEALDSPHAASSDDRFAMVEAATSMYAQFAASRIELDRGGLSYMVATVEAFAQAYPNAERYLLMGDDAWDQFDRWYQPERIRTFVQIAVLARPSEPRDADQRGGPLPVIAKRAPASRRSDAWEPDVRLPTRVIDISSTEVRARVRASKPIRGFVPDAVAAIIESKGLYRW